MSFFKYFCAALLYSCVLLLSVGTMAQQATSAATKYSRVRIVTTDAGMQRLNELGIAADHGQYRRNAYFETDLSSTEIAKVQQAGFSVQIVHDDVVAYYQARALADFERMQHAAPHANDQQSRAYACTGGAGGAIDYPTPANFNLGSMGGFFTYDEAIAHLDNMHNLFPDHISAKQAIGDFQTHQNRPIYWLRLSDNPDTDETDEPEVLLNSVHHAREPAGLSQLIFFAYYLLENYHNNPEIQFLLDHTELYLVPCINPDGYNYNQTTNPDGGGFWRKNCRDNDNNNSFDGEGDGVDLNRNYGHYWGLDDEGSSPDPGSDTYRGTAGFSEPETQAIKWFCEQHHFEIALNYHTYSNLLIYPWGFIASFETPDSLLFRNYARIMTQQNNYTYGTGDQTVGYLVNGDSDDWMYGEQDTKNKILSMTPEVGNADDGFWPSPSRIIPLCKENVWANLHLLKFAHNYAELSTDLPTYVNTPTVAVPFNLQRLGLKDGGSFTVSIQPVSGIASVSDPVTFADLSLLQSVAGNLSYTMTSPAANTIIYDLVLNNNEGLVSTQRITQQFGELTTTYQNACDNVTNFTGVWATTDQTFYTAPSSITDSPSSNYEDNLDNYFHLNPTLDLTNATTALLHFYAKWDIENDYDYVQLAAADVATGQYVPLCGKYTNAGSQYQLEDQPIYDATQAEWVREEIDLSDFLGKVIRLRWAFHSDGYVTGDGFYFDELSLETATAQDPVGVPATIAAQPSLRLLTQPNPASDVLQINYLLPANTATASLQLRNTVGQVVWSQTIKNTDTQLTADLSRLPQGVYFCEISTADQRISRKIVVAR